MNKQTTIWIVVGVLVVVGLGWWFLGRSPSAPSATTNGTAAQTGSSATPTSLKALFAAGTSEKCTVQNSTSDASSSGTIYVASGHMRGDFTSQSSNGQTVESHMITDGTTSWVWTDQMAEGMKMSFTATSSMEGEGSSAQQQGSINPDETMNYSCNGWTPDQSEFTLPANITFSDMSQMMNVGAGASAGAGAKVTGNAAMCTQCNQIANPSGKAACLSALGCSQ